MTCTTERLMDLAESHMRRAGYSGFSFRDLADEAGIRSASVHHHFPTKAMLAARVVRRAAERFATRVTPTAHETPEDAVAAYRSALRASLGPDGLMCLFGVLGAETGGLATEVSDEILAFSRNCVADLSRRLGGSDATQRAFQIIAVLEGGVMLARVYRNMEPFEHAAAALA
jgi:TetR/AcrR family transcriptional repressor of nem operon